MRANGKTMNTALWLAQGLLALTFLYSGFCKATRSEAWLVRHGQTGVAGLPAGVIRFVGVVDLLSGLGVVLPWGLGVAPGLTPLAAAALGVVMVLAAIAHVRLGETKTALGVNLPLLLVCGFVAWGRGGW